MGKGCKPDWCWQPIVRPPSRRPTLRQSPLKSGSGIVYDNEAGLGFYVFAGEKRRIDY